MNLKKLFTTTAAAALALPIQAQEAGWSKYNYGLQVGALSPSSGIIKDYAGTGIGLAAYGEKVWSTAWALRGRVEYVPFGKKNFYGVDAQVTQIGVMLDTIYYAGHRDVLYPFAGIGYFNRSLDLKTGAGASDVNLTSELAYCLGVGWNFSSHLGVEVKYSQCEQAWYQASLLYRF
jgi:hypothetical protein